MIFEIEGWFRSGGPEVRVRPQKQKLTMAAGAVTLEDMFPAAQVAIDADAAQAFAAARKDEQPWTLPPALALPLRFENAAEVSQSVSDH